MFDPADPLAPQLEGLDFEPFWKDILHELARRIDELNECQAGELDAVTELQKQVKSLQRLDLEEVKAAVKELRETRRGA